MFGPSVIQEKVDGLFERRKEIAESWDAYYGKLHKPLKFGSIAGREVPDDNVRLNYAGLVVDTGVDFLFGEDTRFEVANEASEAEDEAAEDPADDWLEACWKANCKMTTLIKLGVNGSVTGHALVRLRRPDPSRTDKFKLYPRVIVLDPGMMTPIYDDDDIDRVNTWIQEWRCLGESDKGKPIDVIKRTLFEDKGGSWLITDQESRGNNKVWVTIGTPEVWPYAWCPVFHCQNLPVPNEFWGKADISCDVIEINEAINFGTSNIRRILRFHSHPKTIGIGFNAAKMDTSPDGIIGLPLNGDMKNLEMQSDLGSSLEFNKELRSALHEISQTPEVATGKTEGIGSLSGVALQILYRPLINKTRKKRLTYGEMLSDLSSRMIEVGMNVADREVEVHWPNPIPVDAKEEAETGVMLDALGVSKDTIITRLGYDSELEAEKKAEEKAADAATTATAMMTFSKGQGPAGTMPYVDPANSTGDA